jgi:L-alanine-DL-glutamate epimerase-like enolase superfamily enzyme
MSFGRSGPVLYALSGLDIALWDLAAQRADKPLWALLGGSGAPLARYASLMRYGGDLDAIARNTARYHDLGYETIKIHEVTIEAFRTAARAAGGADRIMIDVNCTWSPDQASDVFAAIAGEDYFWIEEPIWPADDRAAMIRLAGLGQRLAAGENAASTGELIEMASEPAFAYVQPSVAKIGGISEMLHLLATAGAGRTRLFPHAFYCGPAYLATAHLLSGWPVPVPLETAAVDFEALPHDLYDPTRPTFTFPERTGLGYRPDSEWLNRHLVSHAEVSAR